VIDENSGAVGRVYDELKNMAMTYALKPGQRLNEIELSKQLGVSRTPLREALSRLNTEGFIRFSRGQGFYSRELNQKEVFDLYELRRAIEIHGIKLAIRHAKDGDIAALQTYLQETGPDNGNRTTRELVKLDETFHERLIEMSDNRELVRVLRNVNERIQFVRWIAMDPASRPKTQKEHREVLVALLNRDQEQVVELLDRHISRRLEVIVSAIKDAILHIYMEPTGASTTPRE
jgi:DNA-binding GntR family transcriptional regulator